MARDVDILIVEDDAVDLLLARRHLRSATSFHARVEACHGRAQVLEVLARDPDARPEVILLDHQLGLDCGRSILEAIREAGCDAPIIILSGRDDPRLIEELLEAGAARYLSKNTLTSTRLIEAIAEVVGGDLLEVEDPER